MQTDVINIALAFLEGFALIISPCILPILPIVLSGSLTGNKSRPYGIVVGFIVVFTLFTLLSRFVVRFSGIDLNIVRNVSYALLLLFGIGMLSTYLTEKFAYLTRKLANTGASISTLNDNEGGFKSGILFGGLVALVWTPCAGPILAAVIVQTVLQQTNILSFLTVLAFGIGAAVPMLIIVIFGRAIMTKLNFFKKNSILIRKLLGAIIIASVIFMIYGEPLVSNAATSSTTGASRLEHGITPYPAPEIGGIAAWINSEPLTLQDLKGKVVLIDFWTYSCINCIRTFPYLKEWYQKYHNQGFEIIGVHTPEFEFEKDLSNVKAAVEKFGIKYPVALDNQFVTWVKYSNRFWPAHYLIDKNGMVVYTHFGEGQYDVTEKNIQYLLGVNKPISEIATERFGAQTPETYLGFSRADHFASHEIASKDTVGHYTYPDQLRVNEWALQGSWKIFADKIVSGAQNASLKIRFLAKKVFIVMGSENNKPIKVKLLLDGEKLIDSKGKDVVDSEILVTKHQLYEAIVLPESGTGVLQVTASTPGLEMYTFTFGS